MEEVICQYEPDDEKKKSLVKAKHCERHISGEILFHSLFQDGVYWKEIKRVCYEVVLGCRDCLAYNIGKVSFYPLTPATTSLPFDQLAIDLAGPLPMSN
jgi:hypothetical protein